MQWLTDLQSSMRGPVFAFLTSTWQYLVLLAILGGWAALYYNARRGRADSAAEAGDVGFADLDGDGTSD